jgi:hypothetical protein
VQLGCFGSAICFDLQAEQCLTCKDVKSCFTACQQSTAEMNKEEKTVKAINTKHLRWGRKLDVEVIGSEELVLNLDLTDEQTALVESLPKNAEKLARSVLGRGYDLERLYHHKKNPFMFEKPSYLYSAWSVVINNKTFMTAKLVSALSEDFPQWTKATLYSHVAIVTKVLLRLGAIKSLGGKTFESTYE